MANPLAASGGGPQKQIRFAPLWANQFWTGLWTQRSPLRDAATPYLYGKFYGATRYESLIDGSNTEIGPKLTLTRRPGNSVYNSQTFSNVTRLYDFRINRHLQESIKVIVDTTTAVYDGTGPSTKTLLYTKQSGAGRASMLGVGNTLYMGDGKQQLKWVNSVDVWVQSTAFASESFIVDGNNNIQKTLGLAGTITNIAISSTGTLTVTCANTFAVGDIAIFYGLTTATFLNGISLTILTRSASQFTATFAYKTGTGYPSASDTGLAVVSAKSGTTGSVQPTWTSTINALTLDGTLGWICRGNSVVNWGLVGPTTAPNVVNTTASLYPAWAANTYYSPGLAIIDSNSNVQVLTTSGTAGAVQPTWNVSTGGTTTDGTAVWTNKGTSVRATNHAYSIGDYILVSFTKVIFVRPAPRPEITGGIQPIQGGGDEGDVVVTVTYNDTYKCVVAGTSSSTATTGISWSSGVGSQVTDGTATWVDVGTGVNWTNAAGGASLANTALTTTSQIADANGNLQTIIIGGKSGASAPTWNTNIGQQTIDGSITWVNGGPVTAANTAAWIYCYAWMNSVTGDISTASPLSSSIILAANAYITITGDPCPDTQADKVRIYRSTQGQTTPFALADIFLPTDGSAWSFTDTNPDFNLNQLEAAPVDESNDPPPSGAIHQTYHLNRIFVAVGNTVSYSGGPDTLQGSGNDAFPPLNFFQYPSTVTKLWPNAYGLLVYTTSDVFIISGAGTTSSALVSSIFEQGLGLLSEDCFAINGATAFMFTADKQLVAQDPSVGLAEIGFPIGDQLKNFDPSASYLTWLINGDDKGLFIANGSTGWFRMNPTPPPETGYTWSPFATIAAAGACGAIACVEVSPGVRQLLIGPAASGPILKRDLTTNQDNGVSYPAFATAGSIVVAQPSQVAAVDFIAADCSRVGSNVSISVLINEISGSFTSLPTSTTDPPGFTTSSTLFSSRWYLDQTQAPRECRHLQIKFTWPTENAANELLTFTLFGAWKQQQ